MLTSRLAGCFLTALIFLFVLLVSRDHYAFIIDPSDGNKISATDPSPPEPVVQQQQQQEYRSDVELVVASTAQEDSSWLERYLPEWRAHRYVVNNASAPLTVPANKGREAMVYLTHIIDAYEELPPNLVFVHASRFAWHNDDPDYDALPALRNLRLPHLREAGYVNLRCVWVIGCPSEIRPVEDEGHTNDDGMPSAKGVYKQAWGELMPGAPPVPDVVAVGCCSQFAVTRETIQSRPIEDYVRFRDWLLATPLDDSLSGRIFEFSWHSKFAHIPTYYFLPLQRNQICDLVGYFSFFFVLLLTVDSYFR